jgi:hypothetical protein
LISRRAAPSFSMAMCRSPLIPVLYNQCESNPDRGADFLSEF